MAVHRDSILNKTEVNIPVYKLINYTGLIFTLQIPCIYEDCDPGDCNCPNTENCLREDNVQCIQMNSEKQSIWYLRTYKDNDIYCTEDQEFYLVDGTVKKAKDIVFNDIIFLINGDTEDIIITSESTNRTSYVYSIKTDSGKAFVQNFLIKTC